MQVCTTLDQKELDRLDQVAAVFNLSRAATVRVLLTGALKNLQDVIGWAMKEASRGEDAGT